MLSSRVATMNDIMNITQYYIHRAKVCAIICTHRSSLGNNNFGPHELLV